MNKQKLISILQSRIAKRRKQITFFSEHEKNYTARLALEQKEDKQILKQLVEDERKIKRLRNCATNLQSRIDLLLGWNK